jgi:transcriptional regulator with XRE-family HTH domain
MTHPPTQRALAKRLRDAREFLNLSQQFVAEQTNIPRSAISDIERGERKVDSLELQRLSDLYRFPVSYFLGEQPETARAPSANLRALNRTARDLSDQDRDELLKFALFLQHFRRPQKGRSSET